MFRIIIVAVIAALHGALPAMADEAEGRLLLQGIDRDQQVLDMLGQTCLPAGNLELCQQHTSAVGYLWQRRVEVAIQHPSVRGLVLTRAQQECDRALLTVPPELRETLRSVELAACKAADTLSK